MKIVLHPLLPERNNSDYVQRRWRHERILTSHDDKRNFYAREHMCYGPFVRLSVRQTGGS